MVVDSMLYDMVTSFINAKDLPKINQKKIKSFIKKTISGSFCIYDNGYYINIVFEETFLKQWMQEISLTKEGGINEIMDGVFFS